MIDKMSLNLKKRSLEEKIKLIPEVFLKTKEILKIDSITALELTLCNLFNELNFNNINPSDQPERESEQGGINAR